MALDPSIILAGQPVNVLGALSAGNQVAAQTNEMRRAADMQNLYRTQGAGILAGDQNALNALAGFDPMAAMEVQGAHQGMRMREQEMATARENARLRALELTASMDAATKQAEAAKLEQGLAAATQITDAQTWDQYMTQVGLNDLVGRFGEKDILIAGALGLADALKMGQGAPAGDRFRVVGNTVVDIAAEGGPKVALDVPSEESGTVVYDPATGNPIVTTGTAKPVKFTEAQSKDIVYATRAEGALAKLEPVADALTSRMNIVAEKLPLGLGRELQSPDFQVAKAAGDEFLQAILRKDTGAAITSQEREEYGRVYLPQPGDTPEVTAYRKEARRRAIAALKAGMNADQILAQELALQSGGAADFSAMDKSALSKVDIMSLDPAQLDAFEARWKQLGGQ